MKSRPVVVLTRNAVVGLVTRTQRGLPTEVPVGRAEGLPAPSVINLDNILTVPRQRLVRLMGCLPPARIEELNRAIRMALELG